MSTTKNLIVALAVALSPVFSPAAHAIPAFRTAFEDEYVDEESQEEVAVTLAAAVDAARCNVCHVPDEKKTVRNAYGEALSELLKKDNYKRSRIKEEPEKVTAEFKAAFAKVAALQAADGTTFGARIKTGKLPVDLPPEKAE